MGPLCVLTLLPKVTAAPLAFGLGDDGDTPVIVKGPRGVALPMAPTTFTSWLALMEKL